MAVRKNSQKSGIKLQIFSKKKQRGRPRLPVYVKYYRLIRKKINNFFKKTRKLFTQLQNNYQQVLKNLGLKKGRGRPKLNPLTRWQRVCVTWRHQLSKQHHRFQRACQRQWSSLLRTLHLRPGPGRPKHRQNQGPSINRFFKKVRQQLGGQREIAYIRLHFKKLKRLRIKSSLAVSLVFTSLFLLACYGVYDLIFKDLPSASDLVAKPPNLTTRILDRQGQVLYRVYEDENRTLIPLTEVSQDLINATIAIEDKNFYQHYGFSVIGIMRAAINNSLGHPTQGGSTITQQLVKKRLLSDEKTLKRKLRELLLALVVEGSYSKDQILEMYLNTVPYGGATYGIEETAWRYFNKSASDLDLAESTLLAGLPQAPSLYSPFGPYPERAYARQAEVLRRMVEDGYISQLQADEARAETLQFNSELIDIKAPHFVMYVKNLLAASYGEDLLETGGLEVTTTLDLALQEAVEEIVGQEVSKLVNLKISNGAALVTNPKTGEILAMVGGANYFDFAHDGQVNVVLRPRQPGSSIKPLTYALAFERGENPASVIDDSPITYQIAGSKPYSPQNYDGRFHGRVTLRQALASSYNVPAVKLLAKLGVNNLIDEAEALGISTWTDRSRFGLSLTLGAGEVLMIDLAQAYSAFANLGYPVEPNPILQIKDANNKILYRNNCALDQDNCYEQLVINPTTAYQITNILTDNQARAAAFGLYSVLNIPNQEVAVKTGTTNDMKDNWTIGYTTDRLVATWVGNNDNSAMSYVASGITGASPIWRDIFLLLLDEDEAHQFNVPSNLVKLEICAVTGSLPCAACPRVVEEIFVKGQEPTWTCTEQNFVEQAKTVPTGGQVF